MNISVPTTELVELRDFHSGHMTGHSPVCDAIHVWRLVSWDGPAIDYFCSNRVGRAKNRFETVMVQRLESGCCFVSICFCQSIAGSTSSVGTVSNMPSHLSVFQVSLKTYSRMLYPVMSAQMSPQSRISRDRGARRGLSSWAKYGLYLDMGGGDLGG